MKSPKRSHHHHHHHVKPPQKTEVPSAKWMQRVLRAAGMKIAATGRWSHHDGHVLMHYYEKVGQAENYCSTSYRLRPPKAFEVPSAKWMQHVLRLAGMRIIENGYWSHYDGQNLLHYYRKIGQA